MQKLKFFSIILVVIVLSLSFVETNAKNQIIPNTPAGSNVVVQFGNIARLTFDSVEVAGVTSLGLNLTGPPQSDGFDVIFNFNASFYLMGTTAAYVGSIDVCIYYFDSDVEFAESRLEIKHFNDAVWEDVTEVVHSDTNMVCGRARSLSTFMIGTSYTCGDPDESGEIDISDAIFLIDFIFGGGAAPAIQAAADSDCGGTIDISDAVYLISYIFGGGTAPCASCSNPPIERIIITDNTGFEWDITHAVYQYKLDTTNFNAGLGPYAFTPIINPVFIEPGQPEYPDSSATFQMIGTTVNNDTRAYETLDLSSVETVNDVFPSQTEDTAFVLVGY